MVPGPRHGEAIALPTQGRIAAHRPRLEQALDAALPPASLPPAHLHEAMRSAVASAGGRFPALLVYATGEAVAVAAELLDAPAVAVELMHAFALIHERLLAGANPRARQAIAILAADALQPLAFQLLAGNAAQPLQPETRTRMVALLAEACGANGLVGGRAMHLAAQAPDRAELEHAYRLMSGRLLRAGALCAASCQPALGLEQRHALERFSDALGVAAQIRRDVCEPAATGGGGTRYPAAFGMREAQSRIGRLVEAALAAIAGFGPAADALREMAGGLALRER
jgi:farnesyl diphosphate synthase